MPQAENILENGEKMKNTKDISNHSDNELQVKDILEDSEKITKTGNILENSDKTEDTEDISKQDDDQTSEASNRENEPSPPEDFRI